MSALTSEQKNYLEQIASGAIEDFGDDPVCMSRSCKGCQHVLLARGCIDLLGDLKSQEANANAWKPIETAPKDGTTILVVEPKNSQIRLVLYAEGWSRWISVPGRIQVRPTHWMPIPRGPKVQP